MSLRLNTVTWGEGTPTVLLLHGLGDGAFVWNHIAPVLAAQTAVIAVELRGHGDSPHDPQACYDPQTHAEDVIETMLRVGARPVILIGHSLGAIVAVHVASMAPAQVRGLVLVDGGPGMSAATMRHIREQFVTQPWVHDSIDSFAMALQRRYPLSNPQLLQGVAGHAVKPLSSGGYELKCDRQLARAKGWPDDASLRQKLKSFGGPMLLIRGAASAVLSRTDAARMANELPDCRLHAVPLAGHTVMLDNPDDLLRAIERFLAEISAREQTLPRKTWLRTRSRCS
jgi:pimeloyl-ACP methyl ester carboxylesterase